MHRAVLLSLALLCAPAPLAAAPPPRVGDKQLAARAWQVFEKRCVKCHGGKATADLDLRNHAKLLLIKNDGDVLVTPRNLKASYLWTRVGVDKDMPPTGSVPDDELSVLRSWIEGGAPAWPPVLGPKQRPYVALKDNLAAMRAHLLAAKEADRPHLRFFTLTHLHNNPEITEPQLRLARAALSKVVNSLSWKKAILLPRAIDKDQTILAVNLREFDWSRGRLWQAVLAANPYGLRHDEADDAELAKLDAELFKHARGLLPYVRADWFVARATVPPLYHDLLRLPDESAELEKNLGVDVRENFLRDRLARSGFVKSFVTVRNRVVERHETKAGSYWNTYDFAGGERDNVLRFPLGPRFTGSPFDAVAFEHDQSEAIFTLPNGLQGYYLADGKGRRKEREPIAVAQDERLKGSGTTEIVNGLSCMVCHKDGMIDVSDDVAASASLDGDALKKVRHVYVAQKAMLDLLSKDRKRFRDALKEAVSPFLSDADQKKQPQLWPDPIFWLLSNYYREGLTLDRAAFELGYKDASDLKAVLKTSDDLNKIGLRNLLRDGGTIARDEWERKGSASVFQRVARTLRVGVPWRQVR